MTSTQRKGGTLIESVIAIAVLGIAIPPLVALFREVSAQTVDDVFQETAIAHAESLLEEVVSKAFEDPDEPAGSFGTEESSRAAYDDIDDYDGLSNSPPVRLDGTALDDHQGFSRSATIDNVTAADPDPTTPQADGSTEFKRIRVTVAWTAGRGGEVTLSTLRSDLSGTGGGGSSGPLDEAASEATAVKGNDDDFTIDLVSVSVSSVVIESFSLSADVSTEKLERFELDSASIWREEDGVNLPSGTRSLNEGNGSDRRIHAGSSPELFVEFKEDVDSGPVAYTLVLNFTNSTTSTLNFTINW